MRALAVTFSICILLIWPDSHLAQGDEAVDGRGSAADRQLFADRFQPFEPASYRRPYGPNAPWNIPVRGLGRHPDSNKYARLLWEQRLWEDAQPRHQFLSFKLSFEGYTYPVYNASEAVGVFPVKTPVKDNMGGKQIPWHTRWRPADGSDAQVIVLDPKKGLEWNLYRVRFTNGVVTARRCNLIQRGVRAGDGSQPADYRSKENGFYPSRGIGIQYLAMLVRPEEIMQGEIRHALAMPIRNPSGERFVPPATKLEHPGRGPGIPIGMRFALDVSDQEIEAWARQLPEVLPSVTRYSARVIARALRDYGWFVTDTSGRAHLQFEDRSSAGEKWAALGLDARPAKPPAYLSVPRYPENLLDGLVTEDRIYAIVSSDKYPATDDQ